MKKTLLLILTVILMSGVMMADEKNKILPYPIHQTELANGLKVVTVPFDSPGLVSFYIIVRTGSRNEIEEGVTGFAHFFEHMMFRGTDKYPREKYNEVLKLTGAGANANTSIDRTVYHMTGNSQKLETMFELEADRFMNLNYSEHDFKTEAGAVKGEYAKNNSNPQAQLYENIMNTAFDKHTYKHTTMGFLKDIVDMPNQYVYSKTFFKRFYRPEYSTILCVGDVTPEQVKALAEKYFGKWKHGTYTQEIPVEPVQKETRFTHLSNGTVPPVLSLNYKGPAFSDSDIEIPALDVLMGILFSQNSDLFKKLVLQEQKARYVYGYYNDARDPNLIMIQSVVIKKEDLQYVKDEIVKAIENVKVNGVNEELLNSTKLNMKYSFAMRIDNADAIASSLSSYIALTGDPESINKLYAMYDKVTVEDVKKAANKYFVNTGLTIGTISDNAEGGVK